MPGLLAEFIPDIGGTLRGSIAGALMFLTAGGVAASCRRRQFRDGDTRKIFHFCIFTTAAALRFLGSIGAVAAFGAVVFLGVMMVVYRGEGDPLFEALARQSDRPRRGLHVMLPLIATAAGGVCAHLIAGPLSAPAFLVTGWGDAVGEPVGIRWGRHRFRVPTLGGVKATRSVEGTAAVLAASWAAAFLALAGLNWSMADAAIAASFLSLTATAIESISPHGLDNFTIMVASAVVTRFLSAS